MNDDELRTSLSRRAAPALSADERNDVIRAARVEATKPRRQSLAPRLVGALLGLAAVVVLAIIALPILLSPPGPAAASSTPGDRDVSLHTQDKPSQTCLLAGYDGPLVADPGWGVGLDRGTHVIWPYGYTARADGSSIALIDAQGTVRAKTGDTVEVAGGLDANNVWIACDDLTVVRAGESNQPSPTAATPAPSISSALPIVSAQGLADLIGDPTWVGRTVLAEIFTGQIEPGSCSPAPSGPGCGYYLNVGPRYAVVIGVRDAKQSEGTPLDDGNGYRWVTPLAEPIPAGTDAFKVGSDDIEYLGPVNNTSALSVVDLANAKSDPSDVVYVVGGWLGHTLEAPCAFPQEGLASPMPDISSYYCGGSWLADHEWASPTSGLTVDGGLHVQNDAYDQFATDPVGTGESGNSRQGVYLVRNAGCPEVVTGDCPVWRMVGRLADVGIVAEPSPSSSPVSKAPEFFVNNGTTLALVVAVDGQSLGTSASGAISKFDPSGFAEPWQVTLTTLSGRPIGEMSYSASDISTDYGGTNPRSGLGTGFRHDLSCGRLDVYVGAAPVGGTFLPVSTPGDCEDAPATPVEPPPVPPATSSSGLSLDQAIALAREHVGPGGVIWGYAAGAFRQVSEMFPEGDHILQPPDSATWDTQVWSIVFEGDIQINAPSGGPFMTPRPALTAVYLDYNSGAYYMASTFSPGAGSLPTPFFVLPY